MHSDEECIMHNSCIKQSIIQIRFGNQIEIGSQIIDFFSIFTEITLKTINSYVQRSWFEMNKHATDLHTLSLQKTWWSLQKRMNLISSSLHLQKQQRGESSLKLNKPLTTARRDKQGLTSTRTKASNTFPRLMWDCASNSATAGHVCAAALLFSSDWKHYVAYTQDEVVEHRSSLQLCFPQEMFISDKRNQACDNYAVAQPKPPGENSSASNIRWHFFASNPFFPRSSRSLNKEIKLLSSH